ncbi:hypothetical protein [Candidatus Mycoplasma haematominutum]|uniref:Uncharacterized protein n=1 Tax=Candidatus Mycoplasma haematominutum 'Birmingham 1' TaxID=1116213 RepID=G8C3S0_9MOLU|nr:hypothetical protein [Candidatus Mycoplasma haematominutum]CCE66968.1 hypothetical protein MHM_04500 [Candidatus Mycoplasma haematominutum 'Birmingham 1']
MSFLLQLCLGLALAAGLSSAIAVPVVLSTQGKNSVAGTSGGGASLASVELSSCSVGAGATGQVVDYGDKNSGKVCWRVEEASQSITGEEYTSLFKAGWENPTSSRDWPENSGANWLQQCDGSETSWAIVVSSSDGSKYAGVCDSSKVDATKFVKKQKVWESGTNVDKVKWWACKGDCWEEDSGALQGSMVSLEREKAGNWREVKFQQQS